jgi:ribosomal protein S18 acetylase RimI-like enzyme
MSTSHSGFFSSDVTCGQHPSWRSPAVSALTIRLARQQDVNSLADVLASSFHRQEGLMGWFYPLFQMGIYEDLRLRLRFSPQHYACLVATIGEGELVAGTVELGVKNSGVWSANTSPCLYISNLAVKSEYRRHGIAYRLLATCDQFAQEWGYRDIYLHVLENNHTARRLYWRSGYRLHRVESSLTSWLLGCPKQFFLRKSLRS